MKHYTSLRLPVKTRSCLRTKLSQAFPKRSGCLLLSKQTKHKQKQKHKVSTPKVPSQRRSTPLEPNFHTPSCSSPHVSLTIKLLALHSKCHTLLRCCLFKFQTKLTYGLSCFGLYPSDFHVLSSRTRSSQNGCETRTCQTTSDMTSADI